LHSILSWLAYEKEREVPMDISILSCLSTTQGERGMQVQVREKRIYFMHKKGRLLFCEMELNSPTIVLLQNTNKFCTKEYVK